LAALAVAANRIPARDLLLAVDWHSCVQWHSVKGIVVNKRDTGLVAADVIVRFDARAQAGDFDRAFESTRWGFLNRIVSMRPAVAASGRYDPYRTPA
jgi:hypothetical protein